MAANAQPELSTMTAPARAVPEDLPVARVSRDPAGFMVKFGRHEIIGAPGDDLPFAVENADKEPPIIKKYGALFGCDGGKLTFGGTTYRIRKIDQQQANDTHAKVNPSVWQALVQHMVKEDLPSLGAAPEAKRKLVELNVETDTKHRNGKRRRICKAPVAAPAPSRTSWYQGLSGKKSDLFIRECTLDCFQIMWDAVEKERKQWNDDRKECIAFIVTGPPGLGKSCSSNTIVWHLLKKRQNMWFHSAADHTLTTFVFGDGELPTLTERPEDDIKKYSVPEGTWFLYDSVGGSAGSINMIPFTKQNAAVPCVIFSSPKDTNYKIGIRHMTGGVIRYLWTPPWEWQELKAVMKSFHAEHGCGRDLKEFEQFIHDLYDLWGGIPRRLSSYCDTFREHGPEAALTDSKKEFDKEMRSLSRDLISNGPTIAHEMLENVGLRGENESSSRKPSPPSWLVFPVPIDSEIKGPYREHTYRFCSRKAELQFLKYLQARETDVVRKFCRDVFEVRGAAGIAFERFAHFVLTRTESNKFRWRKYDAPSGPWSSIVLPKCENIECDMKNNLDPFQRQIEKCIREDRCVVIDPTSNQQDAIDMFLVFKDEDDGRWSVLAMQDTIGKTHSFHPVKILEYRQAAKKAFEATNQEVRDDSFLHVVVLPKEDERHPFILQGAKMTQLASSKEVIKKFEELNLQTPSKLLKLLSWNGTKARDFLKQIKFKNISSLKTSEQKQMAGAEHLLLNAAGTKVKGFTWVLDGFF